MNKQELINDYYNHYNNYYTINTLPSTIGNAIYNYGSNNIKNILGYLDLSNDGTQGIIFSDNTMYIGLNKTYSIQYTDIQSLEYHKNKSYESIKINDYSITKDNINIKELIDLLSELTELEINYKMSDSDKIAYFTDIVINDLYNDMYEDIELTPALLKQLKEIKEELEYAITLEDIHYSNELESVCKHICVLIEELEIDSEEVDILLEIQTKIEQIHEDTLNKAKDYYEDVMNQYNQGDTKTYDQLKGMMNMLGISEDDIRGKTPDQLEEFLCSKFNISKEMFNSIKKRMGM